MATVEPLAQSFYISPELARNDNVVYATKIDIYFRNKPQTGNAGVTVMLKETDNGFPSRKILPMSRVHKKLSQVNVSATAATATTFTFEAPIPLKVNKEYCFVIKPDGNHPGYNVWIAKTGGTDVTRNIKLTQDVSDGTLFTSTNGRAWASVQDENIKYTLHRANFTSVTGTVTFTNKESEYFTVNAISGTFKNDEYVFVNNSVVAAQTINMQVGNTTIIGTDTTFSSYLSAGQHIVVAANSTVYDVLEVRTVSNNTQIIVKDIPKFTNAAATFFKSIVGNVTLYDAINAPARMHLDNSTATTSTYFQPNDILIGENSGAKCRIQSVDNKKISILAPDIYRTNTTQTKTTLEATRLYNSDTSANYTLNNIEFGAYTYLEKNPTVIKSYSNEKADSDANRSFALKATLKNTAPSAPTLSSPVLDHDIAAVKVFEYVINNDNSDEDTTTGAADSRYVSKIVNLQDGLDAEDLVVYLTAYNPQTTTIEVYAKFLNSTDPEDFVSKPWTYLPGKITNPRSSTVNRNDLRELEFGLPSSAPVSGAAYLNDSNVFEYTDGVGLYNNYKYFAIKIVLLAEGHNLVPRVADIRAIALAA